MNGGFSQSNPLNTNMYTVVWAAIAAICSAIGEASIHQFASPSKKPTGQPTQAPTNEVVDCTGQDACRYSQQITCAGGAACDVNCIGDHACRSGTITCPDGYDCVVEINGWGVIRDTTINAQSSTSLTIINRGTGGELQTHSAKINCPVGGACEIICGSLGVAREGCVWMTVNAQDSTSLSITAPNGGYRVLGFGTVRCPTDGVCLFDLQNAMDNTQNSQMSALKIYRDTLTNLQITCESSAANCDSPTVYCTDGGTSYSQSCLLERDAADTSLWQCQSGSSFDCFYSISPTTNPTKVPTSDPSKNPTASPTMEPTTEMPSASPTDPTISPSGIPTRTLSQNPTVEPTFNPSSYPSDFIGSSNPSASPSMEPTTNNPTPGPTVVIIDIETTVEDVNQSKANKLLSFSSIFIAVFGCFILNFL